MFSTNIARLVYIVISCIKWAQKSIPERVVTPVFSNKELDYQSICSNLKKESLRRVIRFLYCNLIEHYIISMDFKYYLEIMNGEITFIWKVIRLFYDIILC